jgi:hypothetical protein
VTRYLDLLATLGLLGEHTLIAFALIAVAAILAKIGDRHAWADAVSALAGAAGVVMFAWTFCAALLTV